MMYDMTGLLVRPRVRRGGAGHGLPLLRVHAGGDPVEDAVQGQHEQGDTGHVVTYELDKAGVTLYVTFHHGRDQKGPCLPRPQVWRCQSGNTSAADFKWVHTPSVITL